MLERFRLFTRYTTIYFGPPWYLCLFLDQHLIVVASALLVYYLQGCLDRLSRNAFKQARISIFRLKEVKLKREEENYATRRVCAFIESSVGLQTLAQSVGCKAYS
jgi:hypothetical protein